MSSSSAQSSQLNVDARNMSIRDILRRCNEQSHIVLCDDYLNAKLQTLSGNGLYEAVLEIAAAVVGGHFNRQALGNLVIEWLPKLKGVESDKIRYFLKDPVDAEDYDLDDDPSEMEGLKDAVTLHYVRHKAAELSGTSPVNSWYYPWEELLEVRDEWDLKKHIKKTIGESHADEIHSALIIHLADGKENRICSYMTFLGQYTPDLLKSLYWGNCPKDNPPPWVDDEDIDDLSMWGVDADNPEDEVMW